MKISLTTEKQKNELLARLIHGVSQLRYWQKEKHSEFDHDVNRAIEKWETRIDDLLKLICANEYQTLQDIIDELENIEVNEHEKITDAHKR